MGSKVERNSSVELLRSLSIFGILLLHTFGTYFGVATNSGLKYGVIVNSLCNSCVTILFLISGYYGIKTNRKKIINIWLMVLFYSVMESATRVYFYGTVIDAPLILKTFLPLTVGDVNWYLRTYILIAIFADKINAIIEKEKKKNLLKIIILMVIIFNIIPTFTKIQFLGDTGKGLINMLIVYVIGRYIALHVKKISRIKMFIIASLTLIVEVLLNWKYTALAGYIGVIAPYRLDYSIFILIIGICIFGFFITFNFKSKIINSIAKSTLSIILIDHTVRLIVPYYIDMSYDALCGNLPLYLILYSLFIFAVGFVVNKISRLLFKRFDSFVTNIIDKLFDLINKYIFKEKN